MSVGAGFLLVTLGGMMIALLSAAFGFRAWLRAADGLAAPTSGDSGARLASGFLGFMTMIAGGAFRRADPGERARGDQPLPRPGVLTPRMGG
jgi:hypothetical protein